MNVVDSCGWLEYFADGANAEFFAPAIEDEAELRVPVITLYEVFKRVRQQRGEGEALEAVAQMMRGRVIDLDPMLALTAANLSVELRLPMADRLILATARQCGDVLWTQDEHFKDIPGVRYVAKATPAVN